MNAPDDAEQKAKLHRQQSDLAILEDNLKRFEREHQKTMDEIKQTEKSIARLESEKTSIEETADGLARDITSTQADIKRLKKEMKTP